MDRSLVTGIRPWLVLFTMLAGCGGNSSPAARLGDGCSQNSDCGKALTCSFGRCHEGCASSDDCQDGARCVLSKTGDSVCQLPDNERCSADADCLSPLACGSDGTCRNECKGTSDCVKGQSCSNEGLCAEANEIEGGAIVPPSSSEQGGAGQEQGTGGKGPGTGGLSAAGKGPGTGSVNAAGGRGTSSGGSAAGGAPSKDAGAAETGGDSSGGQATGGKNSDATGGEDPGNESGGAATGGTGPATGGTATGGTGPGGEPGVTGIAVSDGYATGHGFQGYWHTEISDEGTISPECPSPCFEDSGGSLCVQGTAGPSLADQGIVGWSLNQSIDAVPSFSEGTADMSAYTTLTIGIEQPAGEGVLLFAGVYSHTAGNVACAPIANGMNVLTLRDLVLICKVGVAQRTLTDADLVDVHSVVVIAFSEDQTPVPFHFCITHVSFE